MSAVFIIPFFMIIVARAVPLPLLRNEKERHSPGRRVGLSPAMQQPVTCTHIMYLMLECQMHTGH